MTFAHKRKMFLINIKNGMIILFIDHTYHVGADTTDGDDKFVRFFCYLHKTEKGAPLPSGKYDDSVHMIICGDKVVVNQNGICDNSVCNSCVGDEDVRTLDCTSLNLENYEFGQIVGGNIMKHGWVVVIGNETRKDHNFVSIIYNCGKKRKTGILYWVKELR